MVAAGIPANYQRFTRIKQIRAKKISSNLIGVEQTVDGISKGLKEGVLKVHKYAERIEGAHINWPTSWDQVFDKNFETGLNTMLRNC
jgi:hypothetical protein